MSDFSNLKLMVKLPPKVQPPNHPKLLQKISKLEKELEQVKQETKNIKQKLKTADPASLSKLKRTHRRKKELKLSLLQSIKQLKKSLEI